MNGAVFSILILLMRTNSGSLPLGKKEKSLHCQLDALLKENQAPILSKPGVILHIHYLPVVEARCFSPGAVSDQVKGRIQAETS